MLFLFSIMAIIGLIYDRLVGDPHSLPHPARWVGRFIVWQEGCLRQRHDNLRLAGFWLWFNTSMYAVGATLICLTIFWLLDCRYTLTQPNLTLATWTPAAGWPWITLFGGGIINGVWFSFRSLADEANVVYQHLQADDLPAARKAVGMIVGRDTDELSEQEIARATVETVAENSVDGGLSPLVFALLLGPIGVSFFKAVSTLDSMVGYRDQKYLEMGWASARCDDLLNYIPARLAYVIFSFAAWACGLSQKGALRIGWRDGRKHPSPNSAIGESLFAGALGVRLGGESSYKGVVSQKPYLGDELQPLTAESILRANSLLQMIWLVCILFSAIVMDLVH
jgi:adenosylcobinamide-phosphate synthase